MTSITLWIVITVILFLFFCILILMGIRRKKMKFVYFAVAFFLLTVVSAIYTAALTTYKAYQAVRGSDVRNPFDKRTGVEIYTDHFGTPLPCVTVTNSKDQKITGLDFSLWMKFQTCGPEIRRIITKKEFIPAWNFSFPEEISRPGWFNPASLGDSSIIMIIEYGPEELRNQGEGNAHGPWKQVLFLSKDSTQGFYADLEDEVN